MTVRAYLQDSKSVAEETFQPPELSDSFITEAIAHADSNRKADDATLLLVEAKNRARGLIFKAEQKLAEGSDSKLSKLVAELGLALAADDSENIRVKGDELAALVAKPSVTGFDFSDFFGGHSFFGPVTSHPRSAPRNAAPGPTSPRPSPARPKPKPDERIMPQAQPRVLGNIFGGAASFTLDTQLCFVLMPFAGKFQPLYDDHIKPTVKGAGMRCERADEVRGTGQITWDIWERINRARFLIADLTDQNPTVFYELGLAHALSKNVILITQSMGSVPFDLKTIRCITYDFTPRGTTKLEKALAETIADLMKFP